MNKLTSFLVPLFFFPGVLPAKQLSMTWGLENEWSYSDTQRTFEEDGANHPKSRGKKFRTFAFNQALWVKEEENFHCSQRHFELWHAYQAAVRKGEIPPPPIGGEQQAFMAYKVEKDPFCVKNSEKQAPVLYFDFVADSPQEYVLKHIEITTVRFSEYRGGGFTKEQAGYDIVLSHKEGTKIINIENKLVFSGHGRIELRFWSDNYYPGVGWITPMGEYLIDIRFVFSVGGQNYDVATGLFKIDV